MARDKFQIFARSKKRGGGGGKGRAKGGASAGEFLKGNEKFVRFFRLGRILYLEGKGLKTP